MAKGPFYHTGLETNRDEIRSLIDGHGPGTHYYVDYRKGVDANDGLSWGKAKKTYSAAVAAVTSNNNDVIHIDGDSTVTELAMVTLSKNRVHTVGHNGAAKMMGNGAKINIATTTSALDIACVKNTGVRNTFTNVRFMSDNDKAEALYAVAENGEFAAYNNCEFYLGANFNDKAASGCVLLNGDTAQFYDCTIGSTTQQTEGINANVLCTEVLTGNLLRDCYFENCLLLGNADSTDKVFVYAANATDVERMLLFKGCTFYANGVGGAGTPAHAIGSPSAQTDGDIMLQDCAFFHFTAPVQASKGIYLLNLATPAAHTTNGLASTS